MSVASLRPRAAQFGLSDEEFDGVVARLGREPNTLEAAVFGALWSEHCGYKNSRPLLGRLPTEGPQVLQGPGENAGVVDIGDGWAVAFKMESHNHPSAVEPVQGAATGVGGILRDIFAMGARPVAVLDSLRFGPVGGDVEGRRNGWLLAGVVEGISRYGNAIGVPTVGGEVFFHPSYSQNPLVNVMAVGLMRHEALQSGTVGAAGNKLVYVGSRTGRDGLGGAVFASADLSEASDEDRPAVQVGDPFLEKLLLEATLESIERGLVVGVQDMGAAGLSSSVAEMAYRAGAGVDLWLGRVPRREAGMTPAELMLSESQERMVLTVEAEKLDELLGLLHHWELDAVEIGEVTEGDTLRLFDGPELVAAMPVAALNEAPSYRREGLEDEKVRLRRQAAVEVPEPADPGEVLARLLSSPTIASKRPLFERYDHQVMTNTVVGPGAGDAAVLRVRGSRRAIAVCTDCNPRYVELDPFEGARHAVAEAARNVACVGARPLAVTNNLNFGNPTRPEVYYQMMMAVEGLRDACLALATPVTGGNVSLYNQYRSGPTMVSVLPTPTVGMVGVLADAERHATSALRRDGDRLLLLGPLAGELGASEYLALIHGLELGSPPALDLELERRVQTAVIRAIESGRCDTAHDTSEGGLAVALAEMALAGGKGARVSLAGLQSLPGWAGRAGVRSDELLFGEAPSRVILSVRPTDVDYVSAIAAEESVPLHDLGVVAGQRLTIEVEDSGLDVALVELKERYEHALDEALG